MPPSFQQNYQLPPSYQAPPQQANNLDSLHRDIANLISAARGEFAATPWDPAIQQRLKALLDLQTILKSQQLPQDQIHLIQNQVAQLSSSARPATVAPAPAPASAPVSAPPPTITLPPTQKQQPDLQALLSSNALAEILNSVAKAPQPSPAPPIPQIPLRQTSLPSSQPPINNISTPAGSQNSLIASLRAAGMLPPTTALPPNGVVNASQPLFQYSTPQPAIQTPPTQSVTLVPSSTIGGYNNVQLTAASLKM